MALRYAVATGNWSNPAIWNGGTLPGVGDEVRANGFTVTIDQDIDVERITNAAGAPAVEGGSFAVASIPGGGRVLACNVYASTPTCLNINATGTITGLRTCRGGRLTNAHAVAIAGGMTVNITGDRFEGSLTATTSATGLACNTNVTLTLTADTLMGGLISGTSYGLAATSSGCVTTVIANRIIGSGSSGCRLAYVAYVTASEVRGGAGNGVGIEYTTNPSGLSVFTFGKCVASATAPAVLMTHQNLHVSGPLVYAPNGRAPLNTAFFMVTPDFAGIQMTDDSGDGAWGEPVVLTTGVVNPPMPADVRADTTFGVAGELTGTMNVPPADAVSQGTPTGVVTGTASLPLEPLADVLEQQLTSAGA